MTDVNATAVAGEVRRRASPLEARRRVVRRACALATTSLPPLLKCLRRVERNAHASVQRQLRTWGVTAPDSRIQVSKR